ncbi:hypothetical protein P3T36_001822 [Kitasatospora sp. MAP12-15]|uniref:DUF6317 family protein n=1 Tax=unclassified Kitasatospora TaxID=2633591 RepID=UPI002473AA1D|nr:DUF6317 family protein [Kitasatospora sp. MAP12-44]MDH6113294.1 hypothetical protein [Kitasatospora sp. MAP12-44]
MSGQYTVILDDLKGAADTFHREAKAFAAIVPTDGPPRPDGGSEAVNDMMGCVLEALGGLHLAVAGAVGNYGDQLQTAHDNYQKCEVSMRELYDDLIDPSKITKSK